MRSTQGGFTLIEILISVGLLAALAALVLVAVNPARQFAQMRNTQRASDLNGILSAIGQRMVEHKGQFDCGSVSFPTDTAVSPTAGKAIGSGSGDVDLRSCLVPMYISELPVDPVSGTSFSGSSYQTGYRIYQDANSRLTVFAPTLETSVGNSIIALTR